MDDVGVADAVMGAVGLCKEDNQFLKGVRIAGLYLALYEVLVEYLVEDVGEVGRQTHDRVEGKALHALEQT